jgi:hypothetical protein
VGMDIKTQFFKLMTVNVLAGSAEPINGIDHKSNGNNCNADKNFKKW